ncbi:unnamed protein product [Phytophthora lilii]|uniref:Unnamed protein product n=1 Tax=Phytophthora lilii TaxID=2077276 RepID=A0A9W6TVS0_9STRA|nr:unnamed protein product [Phytophthora lilii]
MELTSQSEGKYPTGMSTFDTGKGDPVVKRSQRLLKVASPSDLSNPQVCRKHIKISGSHFLNQLWSLCLPGNSSESQHLSEALVRSDLTDPYAGNPGRHQVQ